MDKLVGSQRKIFAYIYKNRNKGLTRFDIPRNIKSIPNHEVSMHLRELLKNGYISYIGLNDTIDLTSKGLSYFKYRKSFWLETFIKSILCPIIIAFITTLITLWLKGS